SHQRSRRHHPLALKTELHISSRKAFHLNFSHDSLFDRGRTKTGASHLGSLRLSLFKKQTDSLRTSFWRLCQPSRARKRHAMDAYRTKNDKCCRNCVQEMIRRNEFRISGSDTSVAGIALSGCQTRFWASPSQCLFLSDKGPICV